MSFFVLYFLKLLRSTTFDIDCVFFYYKKKYFNAFLFYLQAKSNLVFVCMFIWEMQLRRCVCTKNISLI